MASADSDGQPAHAAIRIGFGKASDIGFRRTRAQLAESRHDRTPNSIEDDGREG